MCPIAKLRWSGECTRVCPKGSNRVTFEFCLAHPAYTSAERPPSAPLLFPPIYNELGPPWAASPPPLSFIPSVTVLHSERTKPSIKHHKRQELPLTMPTSYVATHLEVPINQSQPDGQDFTAVEPCNSKPPSTEAYRNQQFLDVADGLEGPPPFQHDIGDTFIVVHDTHYQTPSQSTKTFAIPDRLVYSEGDQHTGTSDFVLFQDELLWADGFEDVSSSDAFSSQASCCSEISMDSSTESSPPSSPLAFTERQGLAPVKPSHSAFERSHDMCIPVDTDRLFDWLQNLSPSSKEIAPSVSTPSNQSIFQRLDMPRKDSDSHDESCLSGC
jgi:hypothetical protein